MTEGQPYIAVGNLCSEYTKRPPMQFAPYRNPEVPLTETDWLTFMPAQVQQAIYMAACLFNSCPQNSEIPILDTKMGAIKQQAEDAGFVSAVSDRDSNKYINKRNQCVTPQKTLLKGFLQTIAIQMYFNLRSGFSVATIAW